MNASESTFRTNLMIDIAERGQNKKTQKEEVQVLMRNVK